MGKGELLTLDLTDDEIRENFKLLTGRPVSQRTISVGKCIGKTAQWHLIEILKLGLMPLRVGNCYLLQAEVWDELFRQLDKKSMEQDDQKK